MIILTEKKYKEEMDKARERAFDDAWKAQRDERMMERIFALEQRVDKLEGKEDKNCCCETATPVRY